MLPIPGTSLACYKNKTTHLSWCSVNASLKSFDSGRVQAATDTLCVWSGCLPACACLTCPPGRPPLLLSAAVNLASVCHGRGKRSDVRQRADVIPSLLLASQIGSLCGCTVFGGSLGFTCLSLHYDLEVEQKILEGYSPPSRAESGTH